MTFHTLPPGRYYIGDPSYPFQDETWDRILDELNLFSAELLTWQGRDFWAGSTKWGDGTYTDQNGVEYAVDTGQIGIIPLEIIDDPEGLEHGTVIELKNSVHVEYDPKEGTFWIGPICIRTDFSEEESFDGGYDLDPDDDEFI